MTLAKLVKRCQSLLLRMVQNLGEHIVVSQETPRELWRSFVQGSFKVRCTEVLDQVKVPESEKTQTHSGVSKLSWLPQNHWDSSAMHCHAVTEQFLSTLQACDTWTRTQMPAEVCIAKPWVRLRRSQPTTKVDKNEIERQKAGASPEVASPAGIMVQFAFPCLFRSQTPTNIDAHTPCLAVLDLLISQNLQPCKAFWSTLCPKLRYVSLVINRSKNNADQAVWLPKACVVSALQSTEPRLRSRRQWTNRLELNSHLHKPVARVEQAKTIAVPFQWSFSTTW